MNGLKTYTGCIIALAPAIASRFGYDLSPVFGEEFSALLEDVWTIAGIALAMYGRAVAQVPGWFAKRD